MSRLVSFLMLFSLMVMVVNTCPVGYRHVEGHGCVKDLALLHTGESLLDVHSDSYLALPAKKKMERLWANCMQVQRPGQWISPWEVFGIFLAPMCPSFTTQGDEMPRVQYRKKFLHDAHGAVGQVEWRNHGDHPFTGIFEGATQGIVRFSLAGKPKNDRIVPGMGLKFLRDGVDSANLVAMFSLQGQKSWNFFKNDFTTIIPKSPGEKFKLFETKFAQGSSYINSNSVLGFSQYGELGNKVVHPKFPFMLRFSPNRKFTFSDEYVHPILEDLKSIPEGSTLYKIWALDRPVELGGMEKHIGDLVLVSNMIASQWADKHLFFRHHDMAHSVKIFPKWKKYLYTEGAVSQEPKCPLK